MVRMFDFNWFAWVALVSIKKLGWIEICTNAILPYFVFPDKNFLFSISIR